MFKHLRIQSIAVAFLVLVGLAWSPVRLAAAEKTTPAGALKRVAVIPFQVVSPQDGSSTVRCPVCSSVNAAGKVVSGAERIVQELFTDKLAGLKNVEVLPYEETAAVYRRVSTDRFKQSLSQIIRQVGQEMQADILAVGFVYRYVERVGYDYSAEHPASVAFEIHLISVRDGKSLWRGIFDQTQKSLMEDVLQASSFFRGGAKWVKARELTRLGIDDAFKTFSGFEP
ncbi:MAG: hypothetical protein PHG54_10285 [Smithellaceae bacterium]|nr:hypothetical protein [Syntrophaceae bacterium]MDD4241809.1 hypothetical protein [Smithellaceae bacterium]NLX53166.1 hypothetical protein [Deltaproteobacteria bacterium]